MGGGSLAAVSRLQTTECKQIMGGPEHWLVVLHKLCHTLLDQLCARLVFRSRPRVGRDWQEILYREKEGQDDDEEEDRDVVT